MSHITDEQRCIIQRMKKAGHLQKLIAEAIGKSESAVSREIRRNCDQRSGAYCADLARRKSALRKKDKPKAVRFTAAMRMEVDEQLALNSALSRSWAWPSVKAARWSPTSATTSMCGRTRSAAASCTGICARVA